MAISVMAQIFLAQGKMEAAAELCGFLLAWSATTYAVRGRVAKAMQELETWLPPDRITAAVARGRARQVDDVVAELVGEKPTGG
jgi:hypothetical protein